MAAELEADNEKQGLSKLKNEGENGKGDKHTHPDELHVGSIDPPMQDDLNSYMYTWISNIEVMWKILKELHTLTQMNSKSVDLEIRLIPFLQTFASNGSSMDTQLHINFISFLTHVYKLTLYAI